MAAFFRYQEVKMLRPVDVFKLRCDPTKDYLAELIERLDELDELDYFGTEGWRHQLMNEDGDEDHVHS